jgi:hypothetical protein
VLQSGNDHKENFNSLPTQKIHIRNGINGTNGTRYNKQLIGLGKALLYKEIWLIPARNILSLDRWIEQNSIM